MQPYKEMGAISSEEKKSSLKEDIGDTQKIAKQFCHSGLGLQMHSRILASSTYQTKPNKLGIIGT